MAHRRIEMNPPVGDPAARESLLAGFSIEITAGGLADFRTASRSLPTATPVSITWLPGEVMAQRVAAAAALRAMGFTPVPHVSARRLATQVELDSYLAALSCEAEIDRILVVAGDCHPAGPFGDALTLIRTARLADWGIRRVGISGYPGGHPDIPQERLWQAMADKHRALADMGHEPIITTQFGFDAQTMVTWIEAVRAHGITSTIRLGVPGPATAKALLSFAARCGVGASAKVLRKYGLSLTRLMSVAGPDRLIADLAALLNPSQHGDVRIHLYPFGGVERTIQWAIDQAKPVARHEPPSVRRENA